MAPSFPISFESDPWDQPASATSSRLKASTKAPIPDDWEDDDDDEALNEEDNQRIWEDANSKSPNPMPALVISPSATSPRSVLSPPPGAFQPTMRILKRPSNSNSPTTPSSSSTSETIKEREARYQAARERIFGEENGENNSLFHLAREGRSPTSVQDNPIVTRVVRNPRGPDDYVSEGGTVQGTTRGFSAQRTRSSPTASRGVVDESPVRELPLP